MTIFFSYHVLRSLCIFYRSLSRVRHVYLDELTNVSLDLEDWLGLSDLGTS